MKVNSLVIIIIVSVFSFGLFGFNNSKKISNTTNTISYSKSQKEIDKKEIGNMIKLAYYWIYLEGESSLDFDAAAIVDENDSIMKFDDVKFKLIIEKLRKSNYFSHEFIDNYWKDYEYIKKSFNHKNLFDIWSKYDVNKWCICQERPTEKCYYMHVMDFEFFSINKNSASLVWNWNKANYSNHLYKVRVVKENGVWKISYLEGFDKKYFSD